MFPLPRLSEEMMLEADLTECKMRPVFFEHLNRQRCRVTEDTQCKTREFRFPLLGCVRVNELKLFQLSVSNMSRTDD